MYSWVCYTVCMFTNKAYTLYVAMLSCRRWHLRNNKYSGAFLYILKGNSNSCMCTTEEMHVKRDDYQMLRHPKCISIIHIARTEI